LGIPVGSVVFKVEGIEEIKGHRCYHLSVRTFPNKFFKKFYDVEYRLSSYLEVDSSRSRQYIKYRRLGNKFLKTVIDLDQDKKMAISTFFVPKDKLQIEDCFLKDINWVYQGSYQAKIPVNISDLVSCLYSFRLANIQGGGSYKANIFYSLMVWHIEMKLSKPFIKDIHKKGSFCVFSLFPYSRLAHWILGKHELRAYFTCDSKRLPILMEFKTNIGPFRAILKDLPRKYAGI